MTLRTKIFPFLLFMFGIFGSAPARAQALKTLEPGVVKIVAEVEGSRKVGTGLIVRLKQKEVDIVTASHVVEGADHLQVFFFSDQYQPFTATTLQMEGGEEQGVAVIRVEATIPSDARVLTLNKDEEVEVNDEVSFIGFPVTASTPWAVGHGIVLGHKGKQITFSGGAQEGNSGGPLIKDGDVIGLITNADGTNGYATPVSIFLVTLENWKITDDYEIFYERAETYKRRGDYKRYLQAAEDLLHNQAVLGKLSSQERQRKEILLHTEIALDLLSGDYIEGIERPWEKAFVHAEQARLTAHDNFMILFLLGFASSRVAENQFDDPSNKGGEIEKVFITAKQQIEDASLPEEARADAMEQYHYWFGRSLVLLNNYTRGKAELEAGLQIAEHNMPRMSKEKDILLFYLGGAEWKRSNDIEAARQYWKGIADQYYVGSALALVGLAYWSQGADAQRMGKEEKAQEKFRIAEIALADAKRRGHISFSATITLGALYFTRGDYINSAGTFEDATKIDPSQAIAFYWIGRSLAQVEGRLIDARVAMEKAAQLDPKDADAHYYLSMMYGSEGEFAKARSESEIAIELDGNNTEARFLQTTAIMALASKADNSKQISLYEQALVAANGGISACEQHKDVENAEKIKRERREIWNSLAYAYAEREEYLGLALEYINSALKAEPGNPYYLDTKGWVLIKTAELSKEVTPGQRQQMFTESEQLMSRAMASYTDKDKAAKAETFYHLGYREKLQGRKDKARELFLKALELDPGYEKAKKEMM